MARPVIMGKDLGFHQLKAVEGEWSCKVPSIVKRRSEVIARGLKDSEGYVITSSEGMWNVGSKGTYDFKNDRLSSSIDIAKYLAVLGLYNEGTGKSIIDLMVSGLPIDDFKIDEYRKTFTKRLQGDFRFGFDDKQKFIRVLKAITLPQAAGAYFDYILTEDGDANVDKLDVAAENVVVLDIGGNSTDGCIMENGSFSQDSFTIWQGVQKVHTELRKLILKYHRYTTPFNELDDILRTGKSKEVGNVMDLCKKAVDTVYPDLETELSLYIPDFRRFSAVLLCGGGEQVYKPYVEDLAKIPVIPLLSAEYANANGYRKYGLLKVKEGLI